MRIDELTRKILSEPIAEKVIDDDATKRLNEELKGLGFAAAPKPPDNRPAIERIISALAERAAQGDVTAARELREYLKIEDEIRA